MPVACTQFLCFQLSKELDCFPSNLGAILEVSVSFVPSTSLPGSPNSSNTHCILQFLFPFTLSFF